MAIEDLESAIESIKENAEFIDTFIESDDETDVTTPEGQIIPSLTKTLKQMSESAQANRATILGASGLVSSDTSAYPDGTVVRCAGRTTYTDGGGGDFYLATDAGLSADNGTIFAATGGSANQYWVRLYSGAIDVRWFGAIGDGTTDCTAGIVAANAVSDRLHLGPGTWLMNVTLTPTTVLTGEGSADTIIKAYSGSTNNGFALRVNGYPSLGKCEGEISNLSVNGVKDYATPANNKNGIWLDGSRIILRELTIYGCGCALWIDNALDFRFYSLRVHGCGIGLLVWPEGGGYSGYGVWHTGKILADIPILTGENDTNYAGFQFEGVDFQGKFLGVFLNGGAPVYSWAFSGCWFEAIGNDWWISKIADSDKVDVSFLGAWMTLTNPDDASTIFSNALGALFARNSYLKFDQINLTGIHAINAQNSVIEGEKLYTQFGAAVHADNAAGQLKLNIDSRTTVNFRIGSVISQNGRFVGVITDYNEIYRNSGTTSRCGSTLCRPKTLLDFTHRNACLGEGIKEATISAVGTGGTVAFSNVADGVNYDVCNEISVTSAGTERGYSLASFFEPDGTTAAVFKNGKFYVLSGAFKPIGACDLVIKCASPNIKFAECSRLTSDVWNHVHAILFNDSGADATFYLRATTFTTSEQVLRYADIQFVEFDRLSDAQAFMAAGKYAMAGSHSGLLAEDMRKSYLRAGPDCFTVKLAGITASGVFDGITSNGQNLNGGLIIESVHYENAGSGGESISVGTSAAGTQIVNAQAVAGSSTGELAVNSASACLTDRKSIFITAADWTDIDLTLYINFRRVIRGKVF